MRKLKENIMTQEPITDRRQILEQLRAAEVGDELTIEASSGYKDNREVTSTDGDTFTFGDPIEQRRVVNVDRGTIHRITDDANRPLSSGFKIKKLWVW